MTIEERIKEIEGRLGKPYFVGKDHQMTGDITFLLSELKRCREALDSLIDDDDCRFDHHGYCQTHFSGSSPCVMETARQALHPEGVK